ncbi:MAG TPA: peptide ABC transporter substrate-binding protein [Candidatus Dormibacteraeota bacterium]|nr:peptide ABC transporter substrate-binding protein [Candidatus Dormibacteraeota bacterium]
MRRAVAFVALSLLLASCTRSIGNVQGGRHAWTVPGDLRIAIQGDLKNLNPLLASNTTDVFVARLMFEPLVSADARGNPVPMLAAQVPTLENGGVSRDGLAITYHLRRDAYWTDGVPVTARDVKWSWQAIMNPNNNVVSRHGYDEIRTIDTPDPYTVVVHLKEKFSPFVNTFFAESDQPYPIAPAHVLDKYPNINQVPFNSEPTVSDGPFRFGEWSHGDHITLLRNDRFFMGRPGLQRVELKIVPDENTSVNMLRTHAIDWIYQASIETYPQTSQIPDTHIVWMNINGYEDIQLNDARPYLRDVRVRQAIAYALDKGELIRTLTYGQQKEATEDLPDWMWAFDPNVRSYPHDLARARALLEAAGWAPGPDGIMRKNGQPLVLVEVTNPSNVTRSKESVIVQAQLRQAGIEVQVKDFPGDVLFAPAGEGGILQLGHFDLSLAGWFSGIDPDDSSQYMCKNVPPGGYNYSRYCSAAMDAAENDALTHFDHATRKAAYARTQQLLHDDVPEIFVYWYRFQQPISDDFKGFDPNPVEEAWNAWQWSI